jgi:hypothetical protein
MGRRASRGGLPDGDPGSGDEATGAAMSDAQGREDRLKAALRANLRRRKARGGAERSADGRDADRDR